MNTKVLNGVTLHAKGAEFNVAKSSEAHSKTRFEVTDTPNHLVNRHCTDCQHVSGLQCYGDYLVDLDTYKNQN